MIKISDLIKSLFTTSACWVIEVVLLAYYANATFPFAPVEYNSATNLQLAGSIFMKIGFLIIIFLHFFTYQYKKWILLGNLIFMGLGLFLLLIGMGIASKYPLYYLNYNIPVALWFIQLTIFLIGVLAQYEIYYKLCEQLGKKVTSIPVETQQSHNDSSQKLKVTEIK